MTNTCLHAENKDEFRWKSLTCPSGTLPFNPVVEIFPLVAFGVEEAEEGAD